MRASDYRRRARESLSGHWGISILVALVGGLLGASGSTAGAEVSAGSSYSATASYGYGYSWFHHAPGFIQVLAAALVGMAGLLLVYGIVTFIIGGAIELGMNQYNMNLVRRDGTARFSDLFSKLSVFGKALGLRMVMFVFILLWTFLFVIPGIVAAYRYSMAPYLMAQHPDIGIMEALNQSKELMRGYKGSLFCLHLSFIGWAFLAALTFGIGTLWLAPYTQAAQAAFYLNRTGQEPYHGGDGSYRDGNYQNDGNHDDGYHSAGDNGSRNDGNDKQYI